MKKIICFIFGHVVFKYNGGSHESPEEAWECFYCNKDLTYYEPKDFGLELNSKVTQYLVDRETRL
ncbi:MAG: hypothetical protein ACTSQE_07530, partial [Candidatus Heimdallarchaeaceae archaeon]